MLHALLTSVLATLFLAAPVATDETPTKKDPKTSDSKTDKKPSTEKPAKELPVKKRVGRPGDLTLEEEEKLDRILEAFILHDIGRVNNPRTVAALREMGPEAIPALIRAMNRTAMMSDSCPVSMFYKKLYQLLSTSDDEEVLQISRASIGAGVRRSPYEGLLSNLRVVTSQREAQLARARLAKEKASSGKGTNSDSRYSKDK